MVLGEGVVQVLADQVAGAALGRPDVDRRQPRDDGRLPVQRLEAGAAAAIDGKAQHQAGFALAGGDGGDGLGRVGATSFSLQQEGQTKGYVALGQTQTIAFMNDLWEYDRSTEAWTQKANFTGAPRREAVSFVIANKAYVGTGNSATGFKKDFYTYDPSSNSWEQITDFAGTARRAAVAFSMENYGFIGTGDDGTLCNDFWMYNPQTDLWIQKANFPGGARAGACGWAAFPVCYLGTGQDANYTYLNDLWEYNYFLNNWTQRAYLPGPGRKNAVAFYLDGWGFIGTGYNNGTFYDDLWAYSGTAALAEKEGSTIEVFPAPDGPTRAIEEPSLISSETFLSAGSCLDG